jgi:hypothetical protein
MLPSLSRVYLSSRAKTPTRADARPIAFLAVLQVLRNEGKAMEELQAKLDELNEKVNQLMERL